VIAVGLALAAVSTVAINGGYRLQHAAASALPPLALRRPVRSFASLAGNRRWLLGFLAGIAGWALYVAALKLAPLSLVQAASAAGIGVLALGGARLVAREQVGVGAALVGLLLLALSLGAHAETAPGVTPAVAAWLAVSALSAAVAARTLPGGAGLGTAAGVLYAAGDVATKAAVGGGARLWFVPVLLACHGVAFVCMQLAFQRGGRLATAGLAVLWTNALPIVAGSVLFAEALPGGWRGAARIAAFALVVLGAVALGRPEGSAPVDAPQDAVRLSTD
jgi:hypothetical protein